MKKIVVTTALLAGTIVYAGGFRVSLQGVKQLAMAHTSAHAEDASVAFFNPAGMSFIPNKLSVAAGGFGIKAQVDYQNLQTLESAQTNNPLGTPVYAAIAYKVLDDVSVGFSFATPYGSTVEWPDNWAGSEIVQKIKLEALYFQPMVSVKLAPWVSLGGSFIYAKGTVDWTKSVHQLGGSVNLKDDKATGTGFGLGFYFRPTDKLDVSVAYRSPVDMEAKKGVATFNISQSLYSSLGLDAAGKDGFKATLPLVDEYTIGVTYKVTPKWQVSGDFNYSGWDQYGTLVLDFDHAPAGNQANDPTVSVVPKNWKSTQTWRFGTQYMFTDNFAGRLGYYHDETPYADKDFSAESPSFEANVITGGIGYKYKSFGIDLSGAYNFQKPRQVNNEFYNFNGQAKAKAYYFGLGLSYNAF
ncbi:OmpP1/FadL family transporter [Chryseobacterium koreense]|uniref:Aromatic hydrocarbon degradation protein n=1 Tax=Chryseobacterium koreense CCUG 49689 TaxID=1304281 RepID=A0A0J7LQQ1_9FLAO|nr:outer membrane protein transport protein [Chryseobacterium koreense]KMQ71370.1 aromatic hydrocarbon degradation protein [Chryseobacterium koreense CCUG 49689]MBB5332206.1 long-chain fatty acid transport protein [Chryseobacterium koreense]